jgi:hypothetical protein
VGYFVLWVPTIGAAPLHHPVFSYPVWEYRPMRNLRCVFIVVSWFDYTLVGTIGEQDAFNIDLSINDNLYQVTGFDVGPDCTTNW